MTVAVQLTTKPDCVCCSHRMPTNYQVLMRVSFILIRFSDRNRCNVINLQARETLIRERDANASEFTISDCNVRICSLKIPISDASETDGNGEWKWNFVITVKICKTVIKPKIIINLLASCAIRKMVNANLRFLLIAAINGGGCSIAQHPFVCSMNEKQLKRWKS